MEGDDVTPRVTIETWLNVSFLMQMDGTNIGICNYIPFDKQGILITLTAIL